MANADKLVNLNALFSEKLFRIPDYQRGYSWQKSQLEDFWDDLYNLKEAQKHFTGLITLKKLEAPAEIEKALTENDKWLAENNFSVYSIVDGQQRLTTAIILINELVEFFKNNKILTVRNGIETPDDIIQKYICRSGRTKLGNVLAYIFGYEKDSSSYDWLKYKILKFEPTPDSVNLEQTTYTKNLNTAKKFFADKLKPLKTQKKIEIAEELYKKLVLNLKFNIYEIDDKYDVFVAFETMNNRGKVLSNLELLKNRLIYLTTIFSGDNSALRDQINSTWKEIYTWLGKRPSAPLSDEDFLKTHWIVYYRTNQTKTGTEASQFLLNRFSAKNIDGFISENRSTEPITVDDVQKYVQSLKFFVKYYYFTFFPEEFDADNNLTAEEKTMIQRINHLEKEFFRPLLMVAAAKGNCDGKRLEMIQAVERLIFVRFSLGNRRSDTGTTIYYNFSSQLNQNFTTFDAVISKLEEDTAADMQLSVGNFVNTIEDAFIHGEGYYSWSALKYFLCEYECHLYEKTQHDRMPDWDKIFPNKRDKISIEHILPQNLDYYVSTWREAFNLYKDEEDKMKILTGALGNLLLLSQNINSSYQNDSFKEKVDPPAKKRASGYRHGTNSEREVVELAENGSGEWTALEIKKRTEILIDFLIEHWALTVTAEQRKSLIHLDFVYS